MTTEFTGNAEEVKHIKDAIRQLDKLAKKLDVCVGGCGCCGSPYVIYGNAMADYAVIGDNKWVDDE
jgi:hypothetical protein